VRRWTRIGSLAATVSEIGRVSIQPEALHRFFLEDKQSEGNSNDG
jgi:hypothetical protein